MLRLQVPAVMDNLDKMINFVLDGLNDLDLSEKNKYIGKIRLVCEEALVNVINYAYEDEQGKIEILYNYDSETKKFLIKIMDKGIPFNPLEKETPDLDLSLEEREIGGLGIYIIRQSMDEVQYRREHGQNILILAKYLV